LADESVTLAVSAPRYIGDMLGVCAGMPVSRYVALEELGRGGMGRVLRAYDPKLQREVALKEVHRDAMDDEAAARLVAEARAMAKLSHPHVVAVYDVETVETGEVVLVMEYVAGTTLRQWLRDEDRNWRDIVARFVDAGRGLQAAHEAELLHRDFKPANVLVSDSGIVKVTDFGLAKLPASPSSHSMSVEIDRSTDDLTEAGKVMGTPRYMAPEQHRGVSLSPAADQYAFCVALWEALCGEPPFAGEAMAKAKHAGPPAWPGAATPRPIVDAIGRGLAPRPEDRWPSMAALLQALTRDPARRRNRVLLALGGVGAVGLAGLGYEAWADARAQRCSGAEQQLAGVWDEDTRVQVQSTFSAVGKAYADQAWTRAEQALDTYAQDWAAMYTEACEATTVRGEQSPEMMDLRMGCLHRAAVELDAAVEVLAEADAEVVQKAHEVTGGLRSLSRCADTEALMAAIEPPPEHETEAVEAARVHLARARSLEGAGRFEDALGSVEAAKDALTAVEYGPVRTEVSALEAGVLSEQGRYEAARAALEETLRSASRWQQLDLMQQAAVQWMFVVGVREQRMEDAFHLRATAEGLSQNRPSSEALFRNTLGAILGAQGRYAEAENEYRAALVAREATAERDERNIAVTHNNLAIVLANQGKHAEAELEFRTALALMEAAVGSSHPDVAGFRNNLATTLQTQGKYAEAESENRMSLGLLEAALGPDHPNVAVSRHNLAALLLSEGKFLEAESVSRSALATLEKHLGLDHPDVATFRNTVGAILAGRGEYAEAMIEFQTALKSREAALGNDHPHVAASRCNLGSTLLELDRPAEALRLAEQAWARRKQDDIPPADRAYAAFLLARVLWDVDEPQRDRARARRLALDALGTYDKAGAAHEERVREVQTWLEHHHRG
jgi:tetratricopeptide (TPR) repeat protein/tRNA A-37 threonylcarbamoyl transferase component Bud32